MRPSAEIEGTVAGIAEAGQYVSAVVQAAIKGGDMQVDIRELVHELFDAVRRRDESNILDMGSAAPFENLNRPQHLTARRQHWIENETNVGFGQFGKAIVILDRFKGLLIAIHPKMPHASFGNQLTKTRYHAKPGAENWDDRDSRR